MLSVIINTFNRPATLAACLAALARHRAEIPPFEVLVVDDGGGADLEPALASVHSVLSPRLLRLAHVGAAAARNAGLRAARERRILFLGDDVRVEPGCLARHAAVADPWVAITGPYPWPGLRGSPPFRRWADPVPKDGLADPANAGFKYFCTGNLSADRDVLLGLGGFDERYRAIYGWEDIDLGLSFQRAGGRIVYDPEARAVHHHPPFDRRALWRRETMLGITSLFFYEKWAAIDPAAVEFMKFWDDAARLGPGSPLRRALGDALLALTDRLAPASRLNARLYERLIFAHRLAGVAEGYRLLHGDPK